jgi:hypothetical protein
MMKGVCYRLVILGLQNGVYKSISGLDKAEPEAETMIQYQGISQKQARVAYLYAE